MLLAQCARHCLFPMLLSLSGDGFIPHWCAAGDSPQDPLRCSPRVHPCSGYQANRPCVWLVGVALEEVGTHDTRGQGTNILGGLGTPAPSWDYRLDPKLSSVPKQGTLEGCGSLNEHINPGARLCTDGAVLNNSSTIYSSQSTSTSLIALHPRHGRQSRDCLLPVNYG